MDKKSITRVSCLAACAVYLWILFGCNKGIDDPFYSPPVGKSVLIKARLIDQMPLTESTNTPHLTSFFLRIGRHSDLPTRGGAPAGLDNAEPIKILSIALIDRHKIVVSRTMNEINEASQAASCRSGKNDIRELMKLHKNLILLCDGPLNQAFANAVKLVITTDDHVAHEFTSWGINRSDMGGSESIVIHSVVI